jgi:hypothetical protein
VQVQLHDARRSLMKAMPRSTPIPSNQSPGTKHESGDPALCCRDGQYWLYLGHVERF